MTNHSAAAWLLCVLAGSVSETASAQMPMPIPMQASPQVGTPVSALPTASTSTNAPVLYVLDPVETHARFETKFLGFITVRGKFHRTTGSMFHDADAKDAAGRAPSRIDAKIDATTLDAHVVNAHATNEVLRGPDFFNVEKFPAIEFRSTRFRYAGETITHIDGSLSLLGVTRAVSLVVEKSSCAPASGQERARCSADAFVVVKRSEFGMKAWSASISDEVKISVEMVAVAPAPLSAPVSTPVREITTPQLTIPPSEKAEAEQKSGTPK
jgi:polyisoprenoid-binding protein YceI